MILVTVGTQLAFDRLVEAVDQWAGSSGERVVAQIGPSSFKPKNMVYRDFYTSQELGRLMEEASVIVSHAGMGSILTAMTMGKPILIVPRFAAKSEHRNDHQVATAKRFVGKPSVEVVFDEADIGKGLAALARRAHGGAISPYAPEQTLFALKTLIDGI